ncbi:hypothetical protein ACFE04_029466 [Oxalis oulophora]
MKTINKKGSIHPSVSVVIDHLSYLPAAIFAMVATLCLEDKEILAYLLKDPTPTPTNSNSNKAKKTYPCRKTCSNKNDKHSHAPSFCCQCFPCYMNYWVRWDASPNRQVIHDIILKFEDWVAENSKKKAMTKKEKRKIKYSTTKIESELGKGKLASTMESKTSGGNGVEKGLVRRFLNFIGERVMGGVLGVVN